MKKRLVSLALVFALTACPAWATERFADVPEGAYYAQAVDWAVYQNITSGTSSTTFSPDTICTRGQIATFLHRALTPLRKYLAPTATPADWMALGGSYFCDRLQVKLVVEGTPY